MLGNLFTCLAFLLKQHDGICYTLQGCGKGVAVGVASALHWVCGTKCGKGGGGLAVVRGVGVGVATVLQRVCWAVW